MLRMNKVCASAVQTTPSTIKSAMSRKLGSTGSSTNLGNRQAAAQAFCHSAIPVADRRDAKARLPTASSANMSPERTPHINPCTTRFSIRSSGTSNNRPAVTSATVTQSAACSLRRRNAASAMSTNNGKLAKPSRPTATLDICTARKKAIQCNARTAPPAASLHSKPPDGSRMTRSNAASAVLATIVRPSTISSGDSASHLPNSPAKPNSSTAACSETNALRCLGLSKSIAHGRRSTTLPHAAIVPRTASPVGPVARAQVTISASVLSQKFRR